MSNGYRIRRFDHEDEYALGREGRQGAVDWFELEILQMQARAAWDDVMITVPLDIAMTILECAKHGMHKGRGRRGVYKSYLKRLHEGAVVSFARRRKAQLCATGMPATGHLGAEHEAAEEARDFGREWYGLSLSASTIARLMQESED